MKFSGVKSLKISAEKTVKGRQMVFKKSPHVRGIKLILEISNQSNHFSYTLKHVYVKLRQRFSNKKSKKNVLQAHLNVIA